jgi:Got1/Sft2-like family
VLNPEAAAAADQNADEQQQQQPDRLEELAEYCPKLSFQQVRNPEKIAVTARFTFGVRSSSHLSHLFPQRLIGFATCFSLGCKLFQIRTISNFRIVGVDCRRNAFKGRLITAHACIHSFPSLRSDLIAFFSFRFFVELVEGYPVPFAVNYTTGHILQLLASTFLCGPKKQFKYVLFMFVCVWVGKPLATGRAPDRAIVHAMALQVSHSHSLNVFAGACLTQRGEKPRSCTCPAWA